MFIKSFEINKELYKDGSIPAVLSIYNKVDAHGDMMLPGCFDKYLAEGDNLPVLFNHDKSKIAGDWLDLNSVNNEFHGKAVLDQESFYGKELDLHIRKGRINECSIGFVCLDKNDYEDVRREDGTYGFNFKNVYLIETSFVLRGAMAGAGIIGKSRDELLKEAIDMRKERDLLIQKEKEENEFWNTLGKRLNKF